MKVGPLFGAPRQGEFRFLTQNKK